jgi:hypothetical protein
MSTIPQSAIREAEEEIREIIRKVLAPHVDGQSVSVTCEFRVGPEATITVVEAIEPHLAQHVHALQLSARARNVLNNCGIEHVRQLVRTSAAQLSRFRQCGPKTVREIQGALEKRNLAFGMRVPLTDAEANYWGSIPISQLTNWPNNPHGDLRTRDLKKEELHPDVTPNILRRMRLSWPELPDCLFQAS